MVLSVTGTIADATPEVRSTETNMLTCSSPRCNSLPSLCPSHAGHETKVSRTRVWECVRVEVGVKGVRRAAPSRDNCACYFGGCRSPCGTREAESATGLDGFLCFALDKRDEARQREGGLGFLSVAFIRAPPSSLPLAFAAGACLQGPYDRSTGTRFAQRA